MAALSVQNFAAVVCAPLIRGMVYFLKSILFIASTVEITASNKSEIRPMAISVNTALILHHPLSLRG